MNDMLKTRYETICMLIDQQLLILGYITLADVKKLCGHSESEMRYVDQIYGIVTKVDGSTDVELI